LPEPLNNINKSEAKRSKIIYSINRNSTERSQQGSANKLKRFTTVSSKRG
jgi:hypothetical protein